MATTIPNGPAKSTFVLQDRNSVNLGDPEASIVIHNSFTQPNMMKQTTDRFGVPVKFLNGTFYYGAPTLEQAETIAQTMQERLQVVFAWPYGGGDTLFAWDPTETYSYQLKFEPLSLNIDKQGSEYIVKLRTETIASPGYMRNPMR